MAKFIRKLNDRQRAAMIRRKQAMALKVIKKPRAEVVCAATATRTAGQNTIILRTHRKLKRVSKLTSAQVVKIAKRHDALRQRVMNGDPAALPLFVGAIAKDLSSAVVDKLAASPLIHRTGQLIDSIGHRTKNA